MAPDPDSEPEAGADAEAVAVPSEAGAPYLARLVVESQLLATGKAAATGLHLTLWGPTVQGLSGWQAGRIWGFTDAELGALEAAGDALIVVLQSPGPRWGAAEPAVIAQLVSVLRPDRVEGFGPDLLAAALSTPAVSANAALRAAQQALTAVLDIRDPVFGRLSGFVLDTQTLPTEPNPLAPDSAQFVTDYVDLPALVRLPWGSP